MCEDAVVLLSAASIDEEGFGYVRDVGVLPWFKRQGSRIFGEADQVEMVIMIGKNRFGLVPEVEEELNISGCTQHGTGVKFVGIGCRSFELADQRFPHSSVLTFGTHRKESDHADAGHGPEAHGADNCFSRFRDKNMFLSGIFLQALDGFRRPAADLVESGIFAECSLLHLEQRGKVRVGRQSNVNHHMHPGEEEAASVLHSESNSNWQDIGLVRGMG